MICLLSENRALKCFLESLLEELGVSLCANCADASLVVIDLDTVAPVQTDKKVLTISGDPFVMCDLPRPFSQEQFLSMVKEACRADIVLEAPVVAPRKTPALSYDGGVFYLNGERITLTPAEHRLLALLYQNRGRAVPLSLCANALGSDAQKGNMPSVYINHLRRKIDYPLQKRVIVTVRGEGYKLLSDI